VPVLAMVLNDPVVLEVPVIDIPVLDTVPVDPVEPEDVVELRDPV
jgi:hypothetical protein